MCHMHAVVKANLEPTDKVKMGNEKQIYLAETFLERGLRDSVVTAHIENAVTFG